jgi:S1-C subfamily serine protease
LIEEVRLSLGKEKVLAARRMFQLAASLEFTTPYLDTFQKWYEESQQWDAGNAQGHQEAFFEIVWLTKVGGIREGDRQRLEQTVAELDVWKQTQDFKDANRAGRMHLRAAVALQHDVKAVERYAQLGLGYQTSDPQLKEALSYLKEAAPTLNVLASGSGLVVGQDGYVLTNRHVTAGEGQLVVRLPGRPEPVPAELVAADRTHDLALVRVQVPEGLSFQPLSITAAPVSRGTRVGAFGYPLGDLVGKGLKLTTGIISATDEQTDEGMLLLDCRINPGNSGGPLCNARGEVVGIVTAKSYSDQELDSYGLAIPSSRIIEFLGQHLPGFTPAEAAPADGAPSEWDAVDRIVSPSVLMLQKLRTAN